LLKSDWHTIQAGVEVKLCAAPDGSSKPFLLCRSRDRAEKDLAIVRRFEQRLEARLTAMTTRCQKQRRDPLTVSREGRPLARQNTRAARLFDVASRPPRTAPRNSLGKRSPPHAIGPRSAPAATCSAPTSATGATRDLWRAYMQLTQAEAAFRIHKSDLELRPVWHQKQDRVLAHILVCFPGVRALENAGRAVPPRGPGRRTPRVLSELSDLRVVDVILPTADGIELRKRCLSRPSDHQAILLHALGLELPIHISQTHL